MSLRDYWPTTEERAFFKKEGYLVVPDALSPSLIDKLIGAVNRCGLGEDGFFNRVDILGLDDTFLELVDTPKVFAKICGFLGWNIWVNHTHYNVRPPDRPDQEYAYHWHQDGGNVSLDLQGKSPMTAIKVGFYLTDLSEPDRGQTYIIPRWYSHAKKMPRKIDAMMLPPAEAKPLLLKPGSAVLFQQRTFHSQGSPNYSDIIRKTIFIQWAFRWLFPVDTMNIDHIKDRVCDPIRKQLLGFDQPRKDGQLSNKYYPVDSDIPLKRKLLKEAGLGLLCDIGPETIRYLTEYFKFE